MCEHRWQILLRYGENGIGLFYCDKCKETTYAKYGPAKFRSKKKRWKIASLDDNWTAHDPQKNNLRAPLAMRHEEMDHRQGDRKRWVRALADQMHRKQARLFRLLPRPRTTPTHRESSYRRDGI